MRLKRFQTHRNGQAGLATFPGYPYKNTPNPGQVRQAGGQRDAPYACGMLPPP